MASRAGRVCSTGARPSHQVSSGRPSTVEGQPAVRRRGGVVPAVPLRRRVGGTTGRSTFLSSVAHVAGAVRTGAGPAEAWRQGMGVRTDGGVPRWEDLVARAGPDGADMSAALAVHAAARLSAVVGAAPAAMLDRVVQGLERDADEAAQRRSAIAGPQAAARLLAWLPALGLLLGVVLGADPARVLLDGSGGTALLMVGGALTAVGRGWGQRYVRAAAVAGDES